jgi:thiol-disulfide isomerase/thioredoxin
MIIRSSLLISFFLITSYSPAQNFTGIYKIDKLLSRTSDSDTIYVINFWATWCKPCVQELPAFDSLTISTRFTQVKVLLVSLDFSEDLDKKVKPFLIKQKVQTECILLDEINGNDFVNKISPSWTGAIPATWLKRGERHKFVERKLTLQELKGQLQEFK